MFQKSGKSAEFTESYIPISLLLSKLFEKLLLSWICIVMKNHGMIPDYQFGFQSKRITTEQIHRIVKRINNEAGRYCSAVFLDVSQAFDKVWQDYFIKSKMDFQLISIPS